MQGPEKCEAPQVDSFDYPKHLHSIYLSLCLSDSPLFFAPLTPLPVPPSRSFPQTADMPPVPHQKNPQRNSPTFWRSKAFSDGIEKKGGLLALNPLLRFKDGATPVFYQEMNDVILAVMKRNEKKLTPMKSSLNLEDGYLPNLPCYTGLNLIPQPENTWAIYDGKNKTLANPAPGSSYAFITMPDKSIRLMPSEKTIHVMLASTSPAVRYAGNLRFNGKNEIDSWDNCSGAYRPSPDLAHQAGFYPEDIAKLKTEDKIILKNQNPMPVRNIL